MLQMQVIYKSASIMAELPLYLSEDILCLLFIEPYSNRQITAKEI